jgi:hypothetical protein
MKGFLTVYVKSNKERGGLRSYQEREAVRDMVGLCEKHLIFLQPRMWRKHRVETGEVDLFVLPEQQQKIVEIVQEIAPEHGFKVKIVDLSRLNALSKMSKEIRSVTKFPTLVTSSGRKLEGMHLKAEIETFLSK